MTKASFCQAIRPINIMINITPNKIAAVEKFSSNIRAQTMAEITINILKNFFSFCFESFIRAMKSAAIMINDNFPNSEG
ncbi:hypothetical protein SDC9_130042 [bioreactor metagenome]|uniref:Uncharacterized protein n=1 Tax=bioreactor metagenome TaxID=1076179 RepID=A0A645D1D5_9ZZZZ